MIATDMPSMTGDRKIPAARCFVGHGRSKRRVGGYGVDRGPKAAYFMLVADNITES